MLHPGNEPGPDGRAEQEASWWLIALKQALQQVSESVRMSVRAVAVGYAAYRRAVAGVAPLFETDGARP